MRIVLIACIEFQVTLDMLDEHTSGEYIVLISLLMIRNIFKTSQLDILRHALYPVDLLLDKSSAQNPDVTLSFVHILEAELGFRFI